MDEKILKLRIYLRLLMSNTIWSNEVSITNYYKEVTRIKKIISNIKIMEYLKNENKNNVCCSIGD